jgi:hypothetical protein
MSVVRADVSKSIQKKTAARANFHYWKPNSRLKSPGQSAFGVDPLSERAA